MNGGPALAGQQLISTGECCSKAKQSTLFALGSKAEQIIIKEKPCVQSIA